jgi:ElaB/YqjD/DUF883 family membrane-anchored ribosome-binding protein
MGDITMDHNFTEEKIMNKTHDLHNDLEKLKAVLLETTRDAGAMLNQTFEDAKDKTNEAQDNMGQFIADKPFKALGAAVFAGWIIGLWMHRKPHRK